ncbi:family 43 glycosylhydrolase [Catenuloplanes atrovinosus]|uniref:Beta-xylosidase n=1 Tax=Catenuloplanes atrovinosus TaxID=137266 RepID=A0AAE3YQS0_9ACTN|nr:family 43 glycosylhydrolase [Catenuloplanes atrovinosus]MDR7276066.1 beta-xylosidase [Catenuloplanes atrovinosus]
MNNPVLPGFTADPHLVVYGDTYWLYPTTDGFDGWSGTRFRAYSSTDLTRWTDHGVILDLATDITWADAHAWAPAAVERDGRYYLYFCADRAIGVAVADSPAGPFRDALGKPLIAADAYPDQMIDPMVFTDDDGRAYLYWGQGAAYQVPLHDDLVSFDPAEVNVHTPEGYNEAPFVIRRGDVYYLMWSENDTRSADYRVAYATSDGPLGPWSPRRGVILAKDESRGILGTGHHSVVREPGTDDWHIAYHRFAVPGGDGTHRETAIDRLHFTDDGAIVPVVPAR